MDKLTPEMLQVIADLRVAIAVDKHEAKERGLEVSQSCKEIESILDLLEQARIEVADYERATQASQAAEWRAVKRWREATGHARVIPDHETVVSFLLDTVDKLEEEIACVHSLQEKDSRKSDPTPQQDSGSPRKTNDSLRWWTN